MSATPAAASLAPRADTPHPLQVDAANKGKISLNVGDDDEDDGDDGSEQEEGILDLPDSDDVRLHPL